MPVELDVLIFGGGVAGLWLLDELRRNGYGALLLESNALGGGQTVASQGIIHGGFKYKWSIKGRASARAIAAMPPLWRACLAGQREPNLSQTLVRSESCCIWGAQSQWSRFVAWAAGFGLRVKPRTLPPDRWPVPLRGSIGRVYELGEQVIDPVSLVANFQQRNAGRILKYEIPNLKFQVSNGIATAHLTPSPLVGQERGEGNASRDIDLRPRFIVFAAGEGNETLRALAKLPGGTMQRRPLHMVMLRGKNLPQFFGHCIGGTKPRATITASAPDAQGRVAWQVGGLPAEIGVKMSSDDLIRHTRRELTEILPGIDLSGAEWAAYTINRAEASTAGGQRPDDVQLFCDGNILTAWPTKLALAPRLAERVLARIGPPGEIQTIWDELKGLAVPGVALPPWEMPVEWT